MWVDFLNFPPSMNSMTVFKKICFEDNGEEKTVNGCIAMKPTETRQAAKSVSYKAMRAE